MPSDILTTKDAAALGTSKAQLSRGARAVATNVLPGESTALRTPTQPTWT